MLLLFSIPRCSSSRSRCDPIVCSFPLADVPSDIEPVDVVETIPSDSCTERLSWSYLRNYVAAALNIVSLIFFVPGIFSDILTIRATIALTGTPFLNETRSIIGTIHYLNENNARIAAGLILLFR